MSRIVNLDDLLLSINAVFDTRTARRVTEYIKGYPTVGKYPVWTPVSEQVPDWGEEVLVSLDNGDTDIDLFHDEFFSYSDKVIAWMPLPKAYKDGKHE
jgi:hypothetical protein